MHYTEFFVEPRAFTKAWFLWINEKQSLLSLSHFSPKATDRSALQHFHGPFFPTVPNEISPIRTQTVFECVTEISVYTCQLTVVELTPVSSGPLPHMQPPIITEQENLLVFFRKLSGFVLAFLDVNSISFLQLLWGIFYFQDIFLRFFWLPSTHIYL